MKGPRRPRAWLYLGVVLFQFPILFQALGSEDHAYRAGMTMLVIVVVLSGSLLAYRYWRGE